MSADTERKGSDLQPALADPAARSALSRKGEDRRLLDRRGLARLRRYGKRYCVY